MKNLDRWIHRCMCEDLLIQAKGIHRYKIYVTSFQFQGYCCIVLIEQFTVLNRNTTMIATSNLRVCRVPYLKPRMEGILKQMPAFAYLWINRTVECRHKKILCARLPQVIVF